MKRKLALLLAVVMILSLVPMMAFAASDNSVDRVPAVAKDAEFKAGESNVPTLRIEEKRAGEFKKETFRLVLDGAEWRSDDLKTIDVTGVYIDVENATKTRVTVTVYGDELEGDEEKAFEIPLYTKIKDEGEATVTIESRSSAVTGGTYVFANAAAGSTTTTVDGKVTFAQEKAELKTIEVDENKLAGFKGNKEIKFLLTSDFVWSNTKAQIVDKVKFVGGYAGYAISAEDVSIDDEELVITLDKLPTSKDTQGTIVFDALEIEATRDAKLGDVTLKVRGDATNQELIVGKYVDYNVIVEADEDPTEIFAGRLNYDKSEGLNETHELEKLIIKEEVEGAWITDRKVVVEFPSFVKVIGVEVDDSAKLKDIEKFTIDENVVEFIPEREEDATGKAELELIFYVSVEANASGDITAEVSGRGIGEEQEAVLGKALAPVEVEVDVKDVKLGVQRQELGDITLTEVDGGGIMEGIVALELEDGFRWAGTPTVKVTDGDLRIDERSVKVDRELLTFEVTRDSDEASVIEITGAEVDLYRTLPEGEFKLYVGGDALVENYEGLFARNDEELDYAFRTQWVDEVAVAKVITPAPGGVTAKGISLTIGVVPEDGDVAPYINNNRTYAPVSAVAQALGISKNNIIWNEANRTVTVFGNKTIQMTIGSTTLLVNGTPVVMDAAPEITNSRTFLPIAWLAKALDVQYAWDAATQTVTFN